MDEFTKLQLELIQTQKRLLETQLTVLYYKERELLENSKINSLTE